MRFYHYRGGSSARRPAALRLSLPSPTQHAQRREADDGLRTRDLRLGKPLATSIAFRLIPPNWSFCRSIFGVRCILAEPCGIRLNPRCLQNACSSRRLLDSERPRERQLELTVDGGRTSGSCRGRSRPPRLSAAPALLELTAEWLLDRLRPCDQTLRLGDRKCLAGLGLRFLDEGVELAGRQRRCATCRRCP